MRSNSNYKVFRFRVANRSGALIERLIKMSNRIFSRAGLCLVALLAIQLALTPALLAQSGRVSVTQIVNKSLRKPIEQAAVLLPHSRIVVSSMVTGLVGEVHVDIGARVKKGDPLLVVAVPEIEAELAAAEARVSSAIAVLSQAGASVRLEKIRYDLTRSLFEKKGRTRFQLEEADAQLKLAEAALAAAEAKKAEAEANAQKLRVMVGFADIKAPFPGVITERKVDPGALVRGGLDGVATELLTLEGDDKLRCRIEIPELDAKRVLSAYKRGALGLEITLGATGEIIKLPASRLGGGVVHFARSLHPRSHHMLAEIEFENTSFILPGFFGKAKFSISGTSAKSQAFVIPNAALRTPRKGRPHIFVLSKSSVEKGTGQAQRLDVTVGDTDGRDIEIMPVGGASLKDRWVIVRGGGELQGGENVSIGEGK